MTDYDNHLSEQDISALVGGGLSDRDTYLLLLHLEDCRGCMDRYIDAVSECEPESPPDGLNEGILSRLKTSNPQTTRTQIVIVNIVKLGIAVCLTLLLFFSGTFEQIGRSTQTLVGLISVKSQPSLPQDKSDGWSRLTDEINTSFSDFAGHFNNLLKGEERNEQHK